MLMLGEMIGESQGKRTGRRVLSTSPVFKVEVSFEDSGKILGIEYNGITTYWAESKPDGSLYGEGEGVYLLQNGENATMKGAGAGTIKAGGAVSYSRSGVVQHIVTQTCAFEYRRRRFRVRGRRRRKH